MFIDVGLNITNFDHFTYKVPLIWQKNLEVGMFVLVPFRSKKLVAPILDIHDNYDGTIKNIKSILSVANLSYCLPKNWIDFIKYIGDYYICSHGEMLNSALHSALYPSVVSFSKKPTNLLLYEQNNIAIARFTKPLVLLDNNKIKEFISVKKSKDKKSFNFFLANQTDSKLNWDDISMFGDIAIKNAISNQLITFIKSDASFINNNDDNPFDDLAIINQKDEKFKKIKLTDEQENAWQKIKKSIHDTSGYKKPILIHGVTASGKTELYRLAINEVRKIKKKSTLLLLPEIALTPQIKKRIDDNNKFKNINLLTHSKLQLNQRLATWFNSYFSNHTSIIGTRSAIFSPLTNLGLIVVDEEHDPSFKQVNRPCYNARDMAVVLSIKSNATLILGSASPSVESYHNAKIGRYQIINIKKRVTGTLMPEVKLINLSTNQRHKKIYYFSDVVVDLIDQYLKKNKQIMFYLNRRGFASLLVCTTCQAAQCCNNCSLPLTWHRINKRWLCHICNFSTNWINNCQHCSANRDKLKFYGIGTERIAQDLFYLFPNKKYVILDSDHVKSFDDLKNSLDLIYENKVDFIIGTQMIIKGHDFPLVDLVIVPIADMGLNISDFRSSERTYQHISQVTGRAGRSAGSKGLSVIQCYNTIHPAITAAISSDYNLFSNYVIKIREKLFDPPFSRLINLEISSHDENLAKDCALKVAKLLFKPKLFKISGPSPAPIFKKANRFYYILDLKSNNISSTKSYLKSLFWQNRNNHLFKSSRMLINVDP